VAAQHNSPLHILWGCAGELASAVGADCSYNPGWCLSHSTVSEIT